MVFSRFIKRNPLVFLKYYGIVIASILVLGQVSNSINIENHGDTEDFTKNANNDYTSQHILRRYTRQTINNDGKCQIPMNPRYTKYTILGENVTSYRAGDLITQYSVFHINCSDGYNLNYGAPNASICINGIWSPPPTACVRTCTSLMSTETTTVKCRYNNIPLENCIKPVTGTIALLSCNPLYEEPSIDKNPVRVCSEGRWNPSIPQCYPTCGNKHAEGKVNIIGGNNVKVGDYPWQVGIYNSTTKELICGGSIIEERVILSAAHCFTDYEGNVKPASNYLVAAGKYFRNYEDDRDVLAQYSNIFEIHVPERYKGILSQFALDIAILVLPVPLTLSDGVQPVCIELNEESLNIRLSPNTQGVVTGWGYTVEGRELSDVLKELVIPYISFNQCFDEVPDKFRRYITYDKICGGYLNNNMSICGGDSGGGLVFKSILNNKHFVKGIVSTSPALTEDVLTCDSNQYSTYTSLDHHVSFVRDLVALNRIQRPVECAQADCADRIKKKYKNENEPEINVIPYRCRLPNMPQHGNYVHVNNDTYSPGNHVPLATEIVLTCDKKYTIVPSGTNSFICIDNEKWRPPLKTCERTCAPIISTNSTKVKCKLNNLPLETCLNPIENTVATISCEEFYEEPKLQHSVLRSCSSGSWDYPILRCSPVCGKISGELYGKYAASGNYPWQVAVYNLNEEHTYRCVGAIISQRVVLSVAHCFWNQDEPIPKENFLIAAGKRYMQYGNENHVGVKYFELDAIHIPERYRDIQNGFEADISVLILSTQITLTTNIQPICIDLEHVHQNIFHNTFGIVSGWEQPEQDAIESDPGVFQELNVTLFDNETAFKEVPSDFRSRSSSDKIFAAGTLCKGASGGPLVTLKSTTGRYYLTGILTSGSTSIHENCQRNHYSAYTFIDIYIDFIRPLVASTLN